MNIPPVLLAAFPPSKHGLLDAVRRQVDDDMLKEIAGADYGCDAELHLAALRPIRDHGILSELEGWHPGEVLGLIRWSNPEEPSHKPGTTGRRGHQMRAFACAVLLGAEVEFGNVDSAREATLAQCLASTKMLGDEMNDAAATFLTWSIPSIDGNDRWLFALGLLIVASRFRSERISDSILRDATAWTFSEEQESRHQHQYNPTDPLPAPFGVSCGFWEPLAAELIGNAAEINAADVRNDLELIGALILQT